MNKLSDDVIRLILMNTGKHDGLTFRIVCKRWLHISMQLSSLPWWQSRFPVYSDTPAKCIVMLCIEA